jgi:hypothetical protein
MEALGYILMYFLRGSLPWQGLKANNKKDKYEKIMEKKMNTSLEVLCKGFPAEMVNMMNYSRSLRFEDKPDYAYLRRTFKDLFFREGYSYDYVFDWVVLNYHNNMPGVVASATNPAIANNNDSNNANDQSQP